MFSFLQKDTGTEAANAFLASNKLFCATLTQINKLLEKGKVKEAAPLIKRIDHCTKELAQLKQSLKDTPSIPQRLMDAIQEANKRSDKLFHRAKYLIDVQQDINDILTKHLTQDIIERTKQELGYDQKATVGAKIKDHMPAIMLADHI